jgi:hypothetical protein
VGTAHSSRLGLLALVVLLAALAAGTGLRLYAQRESPNVQHDEAWSYASAAGRLGPFLAAMDGGLTGRWVPASEWQRYWQADGPVDLEAIATGLARHDVHPPLYFDLLHVWLGITGMHKWAGPGLNLVFAALTTLAVYGLARRTGFQPIEGALAALTWAVSPAVVSISSIARQYDLVALTATLFVWGLVRAVAPRSGGRRWPDLLWVAAAACAALLTHYQMTLLVAGGALYAVVAPRFAARDAEPARKWPPVLGIAAGVVAAAILAPGWTQALDHERLMLVGPSLAGVAGKLAAAAETAGWAAGMPGVVAAALAAAFAIAFAVPRTRRPLVARIRGARPGWWTILFFLAVTAGGIVVQNLLFLSMPMRLSPRYLAMAWPFLAFVPLLVFGIWPRLRLALTAALCLLVLVPVTLAAPLGDDSGDHLPIGRLAEADAVIVDGVGVGRLPRFLWQVPGDTPVFVGDEQELLADAVPRLAGGPGNRAYYVNLIDPEDPAGGVLRERILDALRESTEVRLLDGSGSARIYEITPKAAE